MNTPRKKVLFLITKSNWGGAQRYVYDLALSIRDKGYDPIVASGGAQGELTRKLHEVGIESIPIQSLGRDVRIRDDIRSFFEIFSILKKEKPDVLHINSSKAGGVGALAGRLAGTERILFTAHGWPFFEDRGYIQNMVIWFLSWITSLLSDTVITVSNNDEQAGLRMPFVKRKIKLVHNGIQPPMFETRESARRHIFKGSENADSLVIGTIGELHPNKGHSYAITAIARALKENAVPRFTYVVIGEGEKRSELETMVNEHNLRNNVFFPGFIPNASSLLKGFDILLFSSIKEGLPYVLIEAGFASLPVISTRVGGIPDIIKAECGVLVASKNPDEMSKAIQSVIKNAKTREVYGENLKKHVEKEFSLEAMVSKTLDLYK